MASMPAPATIGSRLGSVFISVAAALVILGASIVPLLTPAWIHGEQARAGTFVSLYTRVAERQATDQLVNVLLFGGDFGFTINPAAMDTSGAPVNIISFGLDEPPGPFLNAREVAHMNDVRTVFRLLGLLVLASVATLVLTAWRIRSEAARRSWWRAIGRGARGLALAMAGIGILSVVAFDAAFEVFHELLFPAGSFSFDPRTERLVQLFPDQFWSDTALALGLCALVLSLAVALVASRRTRHLPDGLAMAPESSTLTPRSAP
jgi:integral membrane protein (TIGR01906 family)